MLLQVLRREIGARLNDQAAFRSSVDRVVRDIGTAIDVVRREGISVSCSSCAGFASLRDRLPSCAVAYFSRGARPCAQNWTRCW